MSFRAAWLVGLTVMAFGASPALAQIPGLPGGAGGAPPIPGGVPGLPTAAAPSSLAVPGRTGFCANLAACIQRCKAKFCASQFGMMSNSLMTGPIAGVTGGFLPSLCPPPSAAQAAALAASQPGSAAAAAAAIQASEANAKARVAAIEYLGTVDCTRWPEAKAALINGLRRDPNECVRFAAARALNSGCCCDKKVIDALRICVSGETTDDAPAENSCRVKAAAFSALQNCLMKVPEDLPPEIKPPLPEGAPNLLPLPPAPENTARISPANPHIATSFRPQVRRPLTYEDKLRRKTFAQTVDEARRTLFLVSQHPYSTSVIPTGQRSLFSAFARARHEVSAAQLRQAHEQGLVPPRPDQPNPSEATTALEAEPNPNPDRRPQVVRGFGRGAMPTAPNVPPASEGGTIDPGSTSGSESTPVPYPRASARRGLIGMLFQPQQ